MIVTRKMAEEAAALLGVGLEGATPEIARDAYYAAAKAAHPDAGGDAEAFAAVDRAKHVLLEWLRRQADAPLPTPGAGQTCDKCGGAGHVMIQRAWKAMRVQCPRCRGTGCLDTEHEKGDHR